jgi:hypothetical protein
MFFAKRKEIWCNKKTGIAHNNHPFTAASETAALIANKKTAIKLLP